MAWSITRHLCWVTLCVVGIVLGAFSTHLSAAPALPGILSPTSAGAKESPAVALYYGHELELSQWRAFDIVVVEPDHAPSNSGAPAPTDLDLATSMPDTRVYAYVSVAEVQPSRSYYGEIPQAWKLARNEDWQSDVIDQSAPDWPQFFAQRVVQPLWERGYRGFFLDTLDSYRLAKSFDEQAQQNGLVRVIETLHERFPGIELILNRGFEIVPRVKDKVRMVAAESLYQRWNARAQHYEEVPAEDRHWLQQQLRTVQERDGLPVLVIDYVDPHNRALTRATAQKIQDDGFIAWVTDARLYSMGIGRIEVMPRRVLVLYSGQEAPALNYTNAHRYLQMPLNYMGYVVDYVDVREALPPQVLPDRYAGVVVWLSGFAPAQRHKDLSRWLQERIERGMPTAIVGDWGLAPDRALARTLGLAVPAAAPQGVLRVGQRDAMMGFESEPPPMGPQSDAWVQLTPDMARQSRPLLELLDAKNRSLVGGAITPWGGFILDPNVLYEVPGTSDARWIVDPFAFLQQSLRLPSLPVPDTTTENGRRLLLAHVDGDGFNSLAEFAGSPPAAQVLLTQVFEKYRIPQTMSIVEAEVAPHGLSPDLSPRLEDIARRIFKLPHIEVASHTYTHPFLWDSSTKHGVFQHQEGAAKSLTIPGYSMDLEREIVGSSRYINERLAPKDKPVKILQWSGDTSPNARALAITARAGLLNINGGDTSINRTNPSVTAIGPLGIRKDGYVQVYAPITNENIYTNLWTGPFYGFERAIETYNMTDQPRRIKPVGIYYHTYSASKPAALRALHKVYDWALSQSLHPVPVSHFILKVHDFFDYTVAREGQGWRLRGRGNLRTVRLPAALGVPDMTRSHAIAGWHPGRDGSNYVHLSGTSAVLQTYAPYTPVSAPAPVQDASASAAASHSTQHNRVAVPYLYEANARVVQWQSLHDGRSLHVSLQGHVPLEFSLAHVSGCKVFVQRKPLTALAARANVQRTNTSTPVLQFKLPDVAATIQIDCT